MTMDGLSKADLDILSYLSPAPAPVSLLCIDTGLTVREIQATAKRLRAHKPLGEKAVIYGHPDDKRHGEHGYYSITPDALTWAMKHC